MTCDDSKPQADRRWRRFEVIGRADSRARMLAGLTVVAVVVSAALVGCGGSRQFEKKARRLESDNPDVRRESALDMGKSYVADDARRAELIRRLSVMAQSDDDPLVRSAALTGLCEQDRKVGVDMATRMRTDPHPMVRWDAVKVMAAYGDAATIGALIEVAGKDEDERVRREAVKALAKYNEPRVVDALIARLTDRSVTVAHAARDSLRQIAGGVDLGMDVEAWRKWLK